MSDSEKFLDPSLDPETGILRNLAGARTNGSWTGGPSTVT